MDKLSASQWLDRILIANAKRSLSDQIPFTHLYKLIDQENQLKKKKRPAKPI